MEFVFLPPVLIFVLSYFRINKVLMSLIASTIILPVIYIFFHPFVNEYFFVDKLNSFILLFSSIAGIGISLSLISIDKRLNLNEKEIQRFYRFFGIFWLGVLISTLSNNMGLYWIGLEFATLSTVYMIKTKPTIEANTESWRYLIVGVIAISLVLFGIILIYTSAKGVFGEDAIKFATLLNNTGKFNHFLFEIGFIIAVIGLFIKMGFFPMDLWLADIERASIYQVGALFSGILESVIMIGFFRLSEIAMKINYSHLIVFVYVYATLTLFMVAFLIYRSKDFVRLFALSGIEHMSLMAIFWVSGGYFAALLHFAAHSLFKPLMFLSSSIFENKGKYRFKGAFSGYGIWGVLLSLIFLGLISLPPSPMFFSEIYGFKSMLDIAKDSHHLVLMIGDIALILILLAIIFYKFIDVYGQGIAKSEKKEIFLNEKIMILLFFIVAVLLITPESFEYIKGIK